MTALQFEGKYAGWLNAVKGLTLTNVIVIAILLLVAIPTYTAYRALNDEKLLDRFLSEYSETYNAEAGCTIRHGRARGGLDRWVVVTGFASSGSDTYLVSVNLGHEPNNDEIITYCKVLKLIADKLEGPIPRPNDGMDAP